MTQVGVVGLGIMGGPMAANLLKAGFAVTVYNRTAAKCEPLRAAGATVAATVGEVAQACDIILLMLADDAAVKSVVTEIATHGRAGTMVFDASTVHPNTSRAMAEQLAAMGIAYVDTPVTGSRKQAEEGTLTFLVGAAEEECAALQPLFAAMGERVFYLGGIGRGACAKMGNNLMGAIHMAALAEAMSLAKRYGLEPQSFFEIISQSGARSAVVDIKGPKMLAENFHPDFAMKLMLKDVRLAGDLANGLNQPAPLQAAAESAFTRAVEAVGGEGDYCSIYRWYNSETPA